MKRRLADKLLDALETAWEQGREELARRLDLIHQSLMAEEAGFTAHRRDSDDEFDAEDPDSFKRHNIFQDEEAVDEDKNSKVSPEK